MFSLGLETGPVHEGEERLKTEADHSRLVGGSFNKQGNMYKACLGSDKTRRFLYRPQNL